MSNPETSHHSRIRNAPRSFLGTMAALGPGLVVIGSVMGSGELINTPIQAAKYGFILLWAVILSCVIKYFLQIEIGRFTLAHRVTPFEAFSTLPFPKYRNTSWIGLAYLGVSLPTSLAFAGIIGATGGMMHSLIPLTSADTGYVHSSAGYTSGNTGSILVDNGDGTPGIAPRVGQRVSFGTSKAAYEVLEVTTDPTEHSITLDRPLEAAVADSDVVSYDNSDKSIDLWIWIIAIVTWGILWRGVYAEMEKLIMILVLGFSISVVVAVVLIQRTGFRISMSQVIDGFSFSLEGDGAAFAVISLMGALGATANELFMYPYWILEKGYCEFTGRSESEGWAERTRGWIRILQIDVGVATILTTVITAAYFLMGAAVLHSQKIVPEGTQVVEVLSRMFTDSYGEWSRGMFLIGAFCTLFSTLIVGIAAFARMWGDMFTCIGTVSKDDAPGIRRIQRIAEACYMIGVPALAIYGASASKWLFGTDKVGPGTLVMVGQWVSGLFCTPLLMVAICWLAFRTDKRVRMGRASAVCLVVSVVIIAGCIVFSTIKNLLG